MVLCRSNSISPFRRRWVLVLNVSNTAVLVVSSHDDVGDVDDGVDEE